MLPRWHFILASLVATCNWKRTTKLLSQHFHWKLCEMRKADLFHHCIILAWTDVLLFKIFDLCESTQLVVSINIALHSYEIKSGWQACMGSRLQFTQVVYDRLWSHAFKIYTRAHNCLLYTPSQAPSLCPPLPPPPPPQLAPSPSPSPWPHA